MTNENILLDKETLSKAKKDNKSRNLLARAEAEKKMVQSIHLSNSRFDQDEEKLKNIHQEKLRACQEDEERKALEKEYRKQFKALEKARKRDLAQIKETYHYDKHHRHFVDALDAFFSHPPMWIVNVITIAVFLGVFIYFCINQEVFENSGHGLVSTVGDFFNGLFVPDYDMFFGTGIYSFNQSVVYLCLQTFAIAFLGTLFASLLAIPFGFLASKKLFGRWSYISTAILILIRTVPEIVFCYIMIMVTGFSPLTGVVVLSIQSIGMIGKMYSDGLDGMDMTFLEAYDSCGSTRFGSIRVGVFPQVMPSFLSTILYRFDLNLRTASILGLVGAGDLGRLILRYSSEHKWPQLGALMWGLIVLIVIVDLISTQIRKKLV